MKSAYYVILLLLLTSHTPITLAQEVNQNTFLTEQDYPYQMLVRITDKVEVHYTENGSDSINCSTRILRGDKEIITDNVETERLLFVKDAMRACLPRGDAKIVLKEIFSLL
ncbi:hypothetical protein [Lacimicrobium alkaliphilum]|uniref:DUF306 domain-containing protein n=1 Tax=Lacimicrobium alkaliphilum TaxID=1526571 RepID=A0ABQ1R6S6_9ALTE|nr:hypothetical protein [Lacimicrobium alkaliphilum]GGD58305.1 hypothetical protein GCM10011357_12050 [Lacimicrobium alkaliphilum]